MRLFTSQTVMGKCSFCKSPMPETVYKWSMRMYGKPICYVCQVKHGLDKPNKNMDTARKKVKYEETLEHYKNNND